MSFGSCRVLSPDDFEVDDQQKSTTTKIEQSWNLTSPQPPTYRYFYHDDARIRGLVRERFRYFFPLGSENQQPAGENLDYMNQFGTRAHMDSTESSKKRGKKSTTANAKVGSHATGGWVNPKSRASIPKDVGKRIVSAGTNQSGRWLTGQDGRKVYVPKDGQELIGRIAYMNFKKDVFLRLTFDLTCTTILGVDTGCLSGELKTVPFSKAVHAAEEVILFRHFVPVSWWKMLRWLGLGQEKRLVAAAEEIDRFIGDQISRIRREKQNPEFVFLSSYLDGSLPEGVKDVDIFLRDTALSLLAAGKDTTSAALTWLFFMLSENPDIEAKILHELHRVARMKERGEMVVFDAEELSSLVYLDAVICETLRLFPPVPLNHRATVQDDVLPSGHKVTTGMRIIISTHAMGRMKGVWGEDSDQFQPDRWISEKGKLRHEPSYKFLAFSTGPRSCLGKDMALTQLKVAAAAMVYNFEVRVVEGCPVRPEPSLILLVKGGLMVRIKKRVFDPVGGVTHKP